MKIEGEIEIVGERTGSHYLNSYTTLDCSQIQSFALLVYFCHLSLIKKFWLILEDKLESTHAKLNRELWLFARHLLRSQYIFACQPCPWYVLGAMHV